MGHLTRDRLEDVEQSVEQRQGVLRQEQLLLTDHSSLTGHPPDRNLVVEVAGTAVPAIVYVAASGQRRVEPDDAGGMSLIAPYGSKIDAEGVVRASLSMLATPGLSRSMTSKPL